MVLFFLSFSLCSSFFIGESYMLHLYVIRNKESFRHIYLLMASSLVTSFAYINDKYNKARRANNKGKPNTHSGTSFIRHFY